MLIVPSTNNLQQLISAAPGSIMGLAAHQDGVALDRTNATDRVDSKGPMLPTKDISAGLPDNGSSLDAVYRKISIRLLPLFMAVMVLNQVDRTNLAYAAPSMNRELGFGPQTYGLGSSLFFLTFCIFQVPSNMVMVRVGVKRWLPVLLMGWGVAASCFALIHDAPTFFALRLVLGVFEAGALPAMWYHLSQFYPQERLTKPYMYLTVSILIAQILGGPLAAGFLAMDGIRGLSGWQWLFILEGIPSVLMGVVLGLVLPDCPQSSTWLTDSDKALLAADMAEHLKNSPPREQIPKNPMKLIRMVLSNPVLLYLTGIGIMQSFTQHTFILWLPTIIDALLNGRALSAQTADKSKASKNLTLLPIVLTCVPYIAGAIAAGVVSASSQRRKEVFFHASAGMLLAGVFFFLFPVLTKAHIIAGFVCLVIITATGASAVPPKVALVARAARGPSQVIGMPMYNSISVIGGFAGPFATGAIVQNSGGGFTVVAHVLGALILVSGFLTIALKYWEPIYLRSKLISDQTSATESWQDCGDELPVARKPSKPIVS